MSDTEKKPTGQSCGRGCLVAAIVAVVLCVLAVIFLYYSQRAFFHAVFVGETGPVSSPKDWPEPLKKLIADAGPAKLKISAVQVHCLCNGIDQEHVWRMDATPGLLDYVTQKWELSPIAGPVGVIRYERSSLSGEPAPSWWNPMKNTNSEFYACKRSLAGEKGDRFLVALDKDRNVVFVYYWFNF